MGLDLSQFDAQTFGGDFTQIPLDANAALIPYADLKAGGSYGRQLVLPDDIIPTLSLVTLTGSKNGAKLWTDAHQDGAADVYVVNPSGGGGGPTGVGDNIKANFNAIAAGQAVASGTHAITGGGVAGLNYYEYVSFSYYPTAVIHAAQRLDNVMLQLQPVSGGTILLASIMVAIDGGGAILGTPPFEVSYWLPKPIKGEGPADLFVVTFSTSGYASAVLTGE